MKCRCRACQLIFTVSCEVRSDPAPKPPAHRPTEAGNHPAPRDFRRGTVTCCNEPVVPEKLRDVERAIEIRPHIRRPLFDMQRAPGTAVMIVPAPQPGHAACREDAGSDEAPLPRSASFTTASPFINCSRVHRSIFARVLLLRKTDVDARSGDIASATWSEQAEDWRDIAVEAATGTHGIAPSPGCHPRPRRASRPAAITSLAATRLSVEVQDVRYRRAGRMLTRRALPRRDCIPHHEPSGSATLRRWVARSSCAVALHGRRWRGPSR
ncbi:hypothetical protein ACSSV4_002036 [Roseovarius sp. MBR-154]